MRKMLPSTYLPARKDTARLREVQFGRVVVRVKSNEEGRDAERSDASALRVLLLNACNMPRNVLDRNGILHCQAM